MGIKGLSKVIADHAPQAVKENDFKSYFGRKIAIDASMCIYQFLIAVRQNGQALTNEAGETTSHLMGLFYRTIRMLESGMKPVYVFDGKPPTMKGGELEKRHEKRAEAEKGHAAAVEAGDDEAIDKFSKRLVKVTKQHNDECKQLLTLMGVPYVEAPCEAEAQCAELVKTGVVYATATEDMDGLTFGTNILLRHLTASEAKKLPINEYHMDKILSGFDFTREQFVDLCILLGCDYCGTIRGVGPKTAVELIRKHGTIENILEKIDTEKHPVPEDWRFADARRLFNEPEVTPGAEITLKWEDPKDDELVTYLCTDKGFAEDRIRNGAAKLRKSKQASTQGRIDSFFKASGTPKQTAMTSAKRKALSEKQKGSGKKAKSGGVGAKAKFRK